MTISDWIDLNWNEMERICKRVGGQLWEDLRQECVLIVLEKDNVQDIIDSGGGLYYFTRIALNQSHSNTSGFFKQYKNMYSLPEDFDKPDVLEDDQKEDLFVAIEEAMKKLPNYDRRVFELKAIEGESICKLSRETQIPRNSLSLTYTRAKNFLKQEIKKTQN